MGTTEEQFCLKWNDFQQCIKSTFQNLRDDTDFTDVTLSCNGKLLKAHKVILSSCSITFRELLKQTSAQNPIVMLWDMRVQDVSAILDFMYNGEVNVKQEYLNSFLAVAEKLKVRGLWEEGSGKTALDERPPRSSPKTSNSRPVSPPAKRAKLVQGNGGGVSPPPSTSSKIVHEDNMIVVNPRSVKEESVDPLETSVKEERDPSLDYSDSDSNQPLMIDFPDSSEYYKNSYVESIRKETERRISSLGGLISGLGVLKPSLSSSSLPKTAIDYDARSQRCERQRTVFSQQQLAGLELEFARSNFVDMDRIMQLSAKLGLTEKQIKIWFQNRRMKLKRDEKEKQDKHRYSGHSEI